MTKIEKLTDEQIAILPQVRDEWIGHGLSTEPANRGAAEEGVRMAYRAAGLEPPRFMIWADSPMSGVLAQAMATNITGRALQLISRAAQVWDQIQAQIQDQIQAQIQDQIQAQIADQVWDQVRDQAGAEAQVWAQVRDQVWDQVKDWNNGVIDPYYSHVYSAWFDACARIGVTGTEAWAGHAQIGRNAGWWWAFKGFAVLTERPIELHRDPQNRLHCETGPAIAYRDGFAIHLWHGRRVPADLIETGWDMARIFSEPNSEIRRCAIERTGWDAFIADGGLKLVAEADDPGNSPHKIGLYDLPPKLRDLYDEPARILLATNGSVERDGTRRRFGLPVPAHHSDPVAAAADLYGWPVAAYRQLEVRR